MLLAKNVNQAEYLSAPTLESRLKVLYLRVAAPIVMEGLSNPSVLGGAKPRTQRHCPCKAETGNVAMWQRVLDADQ